MYFNGLFDLDQWDNDALYVVFDDMRWSWMEQYYMQFWGGQEEFVATDKYKHKQKIKWGKPCIVLSNERRWLNYEASKEWDQQWIDKNIVYYKLNGPLYDGEPN